MNIICRVIRKLFIVAVLLATAVFVMLLLILTASKDVDLGNDYFYRDAVQLDGLGVFLSKDNGHINEVVKDTLVIEFRATERYFIAAGLPAVLESYTCYDDEVHKKGVTYGLFYSVKEKPIFFIYDLQKDSVEYFKSIESLNDNAFKIDVGLKLFDSRALDERKRKLYAHWMLDKRRSELEGCSLDTLDE